MIMDAMAQTCPTLQRALGHACLGVRFDGGVNYLQDLHQSGCLKIMLPKSYEASKNAVLINTAGGLTGGDRLNVDVTVGEGAHVRLATQTAERIYRTNQGQADIELNFILAPHARFDWLAQETIVFEQGAVRRKLNLEMDATSSVLLVEPIILGRTAMGETVENGFVHDSWRIWRGAELVFADECRLDDFSFLGQDAALRNNIAMATVLLVDPLAQDWLHKVRKLPHDSDVEVGASAWRGMLLVRLLSVDASALRRTLMDMIKLLRCHELPRVWTM